MSANKRITALYIAVISLILSLSLFAAVTIKPAKVNADAPSDFYMLSGAQAKINADAKSGLRFHAVVSDTTYDAVIADANKSFKFFIFPVDVMTANNVSTEYSSSYDYIEQINSRASSYVANYPIATAEVAEGTAVYESGALVGYELKCSLTSIKYNNLSREFFGLAYIDYNNAGTHTYTYASFTSGENMRSIVYVASAAYNDASASFTDVQKTILKNYIELSYYKMNGTDEATAKSNLALETPAYAATSFALSETSLSLLVGGTGTLTLSNGLTSDETKSLNLATYWSSSATGVATVDGGVVTGVAEGNATITAKCLDRTLTCSVDVSASHAVTVSDNCYATVGGNRITAASSGQTVTLHFPDNYGGTWTVNAGGITVASDNTFTMPAADVSVSCSDLGMIFDSTTFKTAGNTSIVGDYANAAKGVYSFSANTELTWSDNGGSDVRADFSAFPISAAKLSFTLKNTASATLNFYVMCFNSDNQKIVGTANPAALDVYENNQHFSLNAGATGNYSFILNRSDYSNQTLKYLNIAMNPQTTATANSMQISKIRLSGKVTATNATIGTSANAGDGYMLCGTAVTFTPSALATGEKYGDMTLSGITSDKITDNGDGTSTFTMPTANVSITVNKSKTDYALSGSGVSNITIKKNGSVVTTAQYGDTITIGTSEENKEVYGFTYYAGSGNTVTVTGDTLAMPAAKVTFTAITTGAIRYGVTVNGGSARLDGAETSRFAAGATVTLVADVAATGKAFSAWTVNLGSVTITDNAFEMPASDVEVTATYVDVDYTLDGSGVSDITIKKGGTAVTTAHYNDAITVGTSQSGYNVTGFTYYLGSDSANTTTVTGDTLAMPAANVTFTAITTEQAVVALTLSGVQGVPASDNNWTPTLSADGKSVVISRGSAGYYERTKGTGFKVESFSGTTVTLTLTNNTSKTLSGIYIFVRNVSGWSQGASCVACTSATNATPLGSTDQLQYTSNGNRVTSLASGASVTVTLNWSGSMTTLYLSVFHATDNGYISANDGGITVSNVHK